jgi:hypothetical protein
VGLGVATQYIAAREAMLAFVAIVAVAVIVGVRAVLAESPSD